MSDHILELLGAYLDGELHGRQLRNVEAHLAECETCQIEFKSLQTLSGMLHKVPAADFPSVERFASNLNLRLARRPATPLRQKALEIGWWMVPVGLLAIWIFLNTAILVSNTVMATAEIGLLNDNTAWLISYTGDADWSATLSQIGLLSGNTLRWAVSVESFSQTTVPGIIWQVSIALLYLCWIAILWARRTREVHGQLLDGGTRPTVN